MPFLLASGVALALYAAAAVAHARAAVADQEVPELSRYATILGVCTHGSAFVYAFLIRDALPGFAESLSALSFGVMVAYAATGTGRLASLGAVLAPVGAVLLGASFLVPSVQVSVVRDGGAGWLLPVHLGLVFSGVAGFFLEFFVGMVQLVVRRRLKRKQFQGLHRLPSLDALDKLRTRALLVGLVTLALGIATGAVQASQALHHAWLADPKVWFTSGLWIWYASALALRLWTGWHDRWTSLFSVLGFVGLVFSVVGLDFVTRGFHAYGG